MEAHAIGTPPTEPVGLNGGVIIRPSGIDGWGGYAARDLRQGRPVIEYVGQKITKAESLHRCEANNPFIFALDDDWDLDGGVPWNPARFLNHSCRPNCEAECEENRVWIVACRDIRAGEELTFNYGYDLEDFRASPCRCGAPDCVGYIVAEEFFPQVAQRTPAGLGPAPAPA